MCVCTVHVKGFAEWLPESLPCLPVHMALVTASWVGTFGGVCTHC